MANIDIEKEFKEIEERIAQDSAMNKDITAHLRKKARLLRICYAQMSDAMRLGVLKKEAPIFAKELAFLNNIKKIQTQINEDVSDTDEEIAKVHKQMYDNGFGWILENLPKKVEE
ncbi:MAG: hypothetical protein K6A44_06415 [bacterium]|nr:hypothetical protein [bacterium]